VAEKLFQEIPSDKRKIDPCDKVKEFIGHQELSEKLGVDFYFATPDHSWERGLNEPTNGLSSDGSKGSISPLQPLNQVFMSSYFESLARKQF
jgi:hypothetical protein